MAVGSEKKIQRIGEVESLLVEFSKEHLNEELAGYVHKLWAMVGRKRNFVITGGKKEVWASAVVAVIARLNFLFDRSHANHLSLDDICRFFGANKSTVQARSAGIEKACRIRLGHEGLCSPELSDMFTFVRLPNGTVLPKRMAAKMGILEINSPRDSKERAGPYREIKTAENKPVRVVSSSRQKPDGKPACGLCGKRGKLTKTDCCGNWICDDEDQYVLFSFARNSCHRNHSHQTLCVYHHNENHPGHWKECPKCREAFETELYVWLGTNEYNFEKLETPPSYEPTTCSKCGAIIRLGTEGYTVLGEKYWCEKCGPRV